MTRIAVTAVADFGQRVTVQLLPMGNGVLIGTLEAADETGLALGDVWRIFRDRKAPQGDTFIPWVSVAYVTDVIDGQED